VSSAAFPRFQGFKVSEFQGSEFQGSEFQGSGFQGSRVLGSKVLGSKVLGSRVLGSTFQGSRFQGSRFQGSISVRLAVALLEYRREARGWRSLADSRALGGVLGGRQPAVQEPRAVLDRLDFAGSAVNDAMRLALPLRLVSPMRRPFDLSAVRLSACGANFSARGASAVKRGRAQGRVVRRAPGNENLAYSWRFVKAFRHHCHMAKRPTHDLIP
jgi:hypothetical protein